MDLNAIKQLSREMSNATIYTDTKEELQAGYTEEELEVLSQLSGRLGEFVKLVNKLNK